MSASEDEGFCHYCGRKPSINLSLEWDHVPALNVKIPPDCNEVRKTLVRACKECNLLASDHPHMDYLERHFWLKGAYLRRYRRLLINEGVEDIDTKNMEGFLLAVIKNTDIKYEEILLAIGFGIKNIEDIESPILNIRTKKSKRILEHIIREYLSGFPDCEDEEDDFIPQATTHNEIELPPLNYTIEEFISFLSNETESGWNIECEDDYRRWIDEHPARAACLELPKTPDKAFGVSWDKLNFLVERSSGECEERAYPNDIQLIMDSIHLFLSPNKVENELLFSKSNMIGILEGSYITTKDQYSAFLEIIKDDDFAVHFPKNPEAEFEDWELW